MNKVINFILRMILFYVVDSRQNQEKFFKYKGQNYRASENQGMHTCSVSKSEIFQKKIPIVCTMENDNAFSLTANAEAH